MFVADTKKSSLTPVIVVSLAYLVFGCIWILVSDRFSVKYFDQDSIPVFQTYKGILFVFISSLIIFSLSWYMYRNILIENQTSRIFYKIQDLIVKNTNSITWIYDVDMNVVYIHGWMDEKLCTGRQTDLRELLEFYVSKTDLGNIGDVIEDLKNDHLKFWKCEHLVHENEQIHFFNLIISVLSSADGSRYIVAHSENVTEYKKVLAQMEENNKMITSILKTIPDILILIENDTYKVKFIFIKNPSDALVDEETVRGKDLRLYLPEYLRDILENKLENKNNLNESVVYKFEFNNKIRYYEARFVEYDQDNTMIIVRNITSEYTANLEKRIHIEHLRNAEEILNFAYWSYDTYRDKKYVSPRISDIFQTEIHTEDDAINILNCIHQDDLEFVQNNYQNFLSKKSLNDGTFRLVSEDGSIRYILQKIINKQKSNGMLYQGVFIDITDEIQMTLSLKEKTFYLNLLSEYSNDLIFIYNNQTNKIEYINESSKKYLHSESIDSVKESFFNDYFGDYDRELIIKYLNALSEPVINSEIKSDVMEVLFLKNKKNPIWVEISFYRINIDSDVKILGIIRDIDEKKKYLNDLELANLRFRYAAKATTDVIWDWDLEKNTFHWTDNLEFFFGHKTDDLPKDSTAWQNFCHPDDLPEVYISLTNAIKNGHGYWEKEYRFRDSRGDYKFVLNRAVLIRMNDKVCRVIGAIHDITNEKNVMKKLSLQNLKLREIAWTQSHIVRAPLARMMGLIEMYELLKDTEMDEKSLRQLIYQSAKELDEIIFQITKKTENIDA
ncbi:MAG: PAS domain-containing protein [Thermaurantimonas sp.]